MPGRLFGRLAGARRVLPHTPCMQAGRKKAQKAPHSPLSIPLLRVPRAAPLPCTRPFPLHSIHSPHQDLAGLEREKTLHCFMDAEWSCTSHQHAGAHKRRTRVSMHVRRGRSSSAGWRVRSPIHQRLSLVLSVPDRTTRDIDPQRPRSQARLEISRLPQPAPFLAGTAKCCASTFGTTRVCPQSWTRPSRTPQ